MGNRKTHVERTGSEQDRVERFDVARLLELVDGYSIKAKEADEFTMTWLAKQKGWTKDRAQKALEQMAADGLVTSRKYFSRTLWRMVQR